VGTCIALIDTGLLGLLPLEGNRREVAQRRLSFILPARFMLCNIPSLASWVRNSKAAYSTPRSPWNSTPALAPSARLDIGSSPLVDEARAPEVLDSSGQLFLGPADWHDAKLQTKSAACVQLRANYGAGLRWLLVRGTSYRSSANPLPTAFAETRRSGGDVTRLGNSGLP
jgi:hypothetical protein